MRCRQLEEELQETRQNNLSTFIRPEVYESRIEELRNRAELAEATLHQAKGDCERLHRLQDWRAERGEREPSVRRLWLEDLPNPVTKVQSRPDSPLLSIAQRSLSSDLLTLQSPLGKGRKVSASTSITDYVLEDSCPKMPPEEGHIQSLVRSNTTDTPSSNINSPFDLQSPQFGDRDASLDRLDALSSSQHVVQDMVSVSTVGAGPSVQLVERMSAAIRRLEGEKVTAREELARISSQRDEARAEIVTLIKDVASGKTALARVHELESEVNEINSRYQTTLEMLGEKSELVEELRADVADVKAMYRDLVERTIK
jgi:TATA element modulatory factor